MGIYDKFTLLKKKVVKIFKFNSLKKEKNQKQNRQKNNPKQNRQN